MTVAASKRQQADACGMRSVSYPITIHVSAGARPSPDTPDMVSVTSRESSRVLLRGQLQRAVARDQRHVRGQTRHDLIPTRRDLSNCMMRVARPLRRRAHACGEKPYDSAQRSSAPPRAPALRVLFGCGLRFLNLQKG